MGYLDFYQEKNAKKKVKILAKYATEVLGMTADTNLNDGVTQLDLDKLSKMSPLRMQFHQCTDANNDERHLC